jgi:YidC/Oxa1 family membrane protein insertase
MDKKTIIAIVISAILFIGYFLITNFLFPAKPADQTAKTTQTTEPNKGPEKNTPVVEAVPVKTELKEESATIHSKMFDITFSNKGGVVTSIKLNDADKDPGNKRLDDSIEMVYAYNSAMPEKAASVTEWPFNIRFGNYEAPPVMDLFQMKELDGKKIQFSRDFNLMVSAGEGKAPVAKKITLTRTYQVTDDYMLIMLISIQTANNEELSFDFGGVSYTLGIGPQIGPAFKGHAPDERSDYRRFVLLMNDGRKEMNLGIGAKPETLPGTFSWAAIMSKYYALIALANTPTKNIVLDSRDLASGFLRSAMYIQREGTKIIKANDMYAFYIGPKRNDILSGYKEINFDIDGYKLNRTDIKFSELAPVSFLFGWIAQVLKYPLDFFALVGNYGLAIIFLTILIKVLLYPLTRKSFDSMRKMQAVKPKLDELRAKYKDNPKRMNAEMADLYKREGISPLGGCLPQLLQLPIMFALYELFNTHFALKGAVFIPGWINDLSVPESVWTLPFPPINILGFVLSDLRLLPLIMLATQFATTFFTQGQNTGGDNKMKYLPYVLMGVFFFVLYNLPAGLVLYWTMQNILTVLQQVIQKFLSERKKKIQAVS